MDNSEFSKPILIITYGVEGHSINPRTLTLTLTMFTEALTTIERTLYADEQFEFVIDAFENGSFKVVIKKIGKITSDIAIAVFASFIFSSMHPDKPPIIIVTPDEVIIEYHGNTIIVPKEKAAEYNKVRQNSSVNGQMREAFSVLDNDKNIHYMEFAANSPSFKNPIKIPKDSFGNVVQGKEQTSKDKIYDNVTLIILSKKSEGKNYFFECLWDGKIIDVSFIDRGDYIRPGLFKVNDEIIVRLVETQTNDYYTENLIHSEYEIISVYKHLKK